MNDSMISNELMPRYLDPKTDEKATYTRSELEAYENYWDQIRRENTLVLDAIDKGELKGKIKTAKAMLALGIDIEVILQATQLSKEQIYN